ncbi:MAG: DISARM system SNF2-like helicase DrmD [Geminicoccaceae bacterium]|nr:DISARM system SNF2-like helicase DrmD [Geminicoccaceae bacterium]
MSTAADRSARAGSARPTVPGPGALVRVRARHWLVEEVSGPHRADAAHLVRLLGADEDNAERRLAVLWEKELDAEPLAEAGFDKLGERGFDANALFAGYLYNLRWNAVTAADPRLLQAPFRAGIRLEPYQLEPLAKALRLPRVNLLIADDVGLGKTIEAGLVVRELLLRGRIDLLVVAAPPSMLHQWQEELATRFGLEAVLVDRLYLRELRRKRGFSADPWASHTRFLISHQLLADEAWREGLERRLGAFRPKSLLVLDEAHHAAPASGEKLAIDSQFTRAIRDLARRFEHRLFLTATPHNGHSNSFSALLEILDPQRFVRGLKVRKGDLEPVAVRRLKEDLRALGEPGRGFPERRVEPIVVDGLPEDAPELVLGRLLAQYRELVETRLASAQTSRRRPALLLLATLQHRLLSSIPAFAATLERHRRAVERAEQRAGARSLRLDALASELEPVSADLAEEASELADEGEEPEVEAVQLDAVEQLSAATLAGPSAAERALLEEMATIAHQAKLRADRRIAWLLDWIDREACPGFRSDPGRARWTDERLVIFTEWEETRRWLERHLRNALDGTDRAEERIACFTGASSMETRRRIQRAFNAPPEENPIRILLCTDAAREGLNLQRHCRQLVHFDLPWNPARIEQRNGRIDRKLQPAPEVVCRYFFFAQRPEDRVLQALLRKTETIRRELGPMGTVLDERLHRRLERGIRPEEAEQLAFAIEQEDISGRSTILEELEEERTSEAKSRLADRLDQLARQLETSRKVLRFDPDRLRCVVDAGLRLLFASRGLLPAGEERASDGSPIPLYRIDPEDPGLRADPRLARLVETLRPPPALRGELGEAIRPVTFVETDRLGDRVVQLHLEHPFVRRVLARFGTQGIVEHLLSRACLSAAEVREPRVLLLGRLLLYGPAAVRLHEELLATAAPWVPPEQRREPLRPLTERTTGQLLDELEELLGGEPGPPVPQTVQAMLQAAIPRDVAELRPALEERARAAEERARRALAERGTQESANLARLLEELQARLSRELEQPPDPQLTLALSEPERRQREAERRAQEERLCALARDKESEPERLRAQYEVKAWRLEPVGIVYLWPAAGQRR